MNTSTILSILGALWSSITAALAQPVFTVDPQFNPFITDTSGRLNSLSVSDGGSIYVAGAFDAIDGIPCKGVARLNATGGLDRSFSAEVSADKVEITAAALQPDGKLVVAGVFFVRNSEGRSEILRLNPDGSRDKDLHLAWPSNEIPVRLLLQRDGKIIAAGSPSQSSTKIARFNADGGKDFTFSQISLDGSDALQGMLLQPDGKFVLWGFFTKLNGKEGGGLVRFNIDGTLDLGFRQTLHSAFPNNSGIGVQSVTLLPNGKLLVGGFLSGGSVRLNSDGSVDSAFPSGLSGPVLIQPDGKLIETRASGGISRLTTDGTGDSSFSSSLDSARAWALLSDGKLLIDDGSQILKLNSDGTVDPSFTPTALEVPGSVGEVLKQPDGKIVFVGEFSHVNGVPRRSIARLNGDGSVDSSFGASPDVPHFALHLGWDMTDLGKLRYQPSDDKLVVAGRGSLVRLNADGSRDTGFRSDINQLIIDFVPQGDGKLLLLLNEGPSKNNVVRLNQDGSLDSSFIWRGDLTDARAIALQSDDKLLVGTALDSNGTGSTIVRVNLDGTIDTTFTPPVFEPWMGGAPKIIVQRDGMILVVLGSSVTRLNPDGRTDAGFGSKAIPGTSVVDGVGVFDDLRGLVITSENSLVLFGVIRGIDSNCLFHDCESGNLIFLSPSGQFDGRVSQLEKDFFSNSFALTRAVVPLSDGRLLLAGPIARNNSPLGSEMIRLRPVSTISSFNLSQSAISLTIGGESGWTYHIETSTDLVHWMPVRDVQSTGAVTKFWEETPVGEPRRFYRTALRF